MAGSLTRRLRHDRWTVLLGLGGVTVAAWIYVAVLSRQMSTGMADSSMVGAMQSMVHLRTWSATDFGLTLSMWGVMMVAMMVPTAVPMTLIYAAVARKSAREGHAVPPTFVFVAGYLAVWALFSIVATISQLTLDQLSLLSPLMVSASRLLAGALLIAAGVYELTPYKHACLAQCRAPAQFIAQHWRVGSAGAFRLGLALGVYCLGCCWILMGLLFVGGVMNLLLIAAITVFILLEKTLPFGATGGRVVGAMMILVGLVSLAGLIAPI